MAPDLPRAPSKLISPPGVRPAAARPNSARVGAVTMEADGDDKRAGTGAGDSFAGSTQPGRAGRTVRSSSDASSVDSAGSRGASSTETAAAMPWVSWLAACPFADVSSWRCGAAVSKAVEGAASTCFANESNSWLALPVDSAAAWTTVVSAAFGCSEGGAVHVGHSRMAGEHSCPHSGQIQYSIYIHSRTKVLLYLSVTHPTLF